PTVQFSDVSGFRFRLPTRSPRALIVSPPIRSVEAPPGPLPNTWISPGCRNEVPAEARRKRRGLGVHRIPILGSNESRLSILSYRPASCTSKVDEGSITSSTKAASVALEPPKSDEAKAPLKAQLP